MLLGLDCFYNLLRKDDATITSLSVITIVLICFVVLFLVDGNVGPGNRRYKIISLFVALYFSVGALIMTLAYFDYDTLANQVYCAELSFKHEKKRLEDAHKHELEKAEAKVKIAEIEAKRLALTSHSTESNIEHQNKLKSARESLVKLKAKSVDYSSISKQSEQRKQTPFDERFKLILSALWLGACFFLQRIFEKLFHDKGYALLAVCAAGFLVAFFSANYFLLGGSITGGLMGSAGGNKT